ncbi:anion permease [Candidatus Bipolaricaulota bacterium]|nr:anion permease [Candidatus Bipolaricaulota bacterium]TFH09315.1 MAG: inorganic phosphate transporter [Candidatus Atribacteria bacterium]
MSNLILLLLAGFYVGWNIGANDAGNCIGTAVGSGLLRYRSAAILVSVFAVLGALLQGGHVMKTVGKGIVTTELSVTAIAIALLCSGLFVTVATLLRLPVSTSQVIVGGVAGVGLAVGADLNVGTIISIAEVWVICPILTAIIAMAIFWISRLLLQRASRIYFWQRVPHVLLILSACYLAFSLGANHVGTAMGPITNLGLNISTLWISVLGGFAMASGTLTFGHRVTQTVGGGIAPLDPVSAFSAQLAAALAVHFFSLYGIPVSTSQAVVGAIIGVGILQGVTTVRTKKLAVIAAGWVATPTAAGLFSFALYRLVLAFAG